VKNAEAKEPLFRKEEMACLIKELRCAVTNVADLGKLIGSKKRQEKSESQDSDTKEKVHLEEGELICDKCEGEGVIIYSNIDESYADLTCDKCAGTGKVDWVENIVGKKLIPAMDSSSQIHIHNDTLDAMAKILRDEIDKDILETITKEAEQNNKIQTFSSVIGFIRGNIF